MGAAAPEVARPLRLPVSRRDRSRLRAGVNFNDINHNQKGNMSTPLAACVAAIVVGFILLVADVEERVGWLLVVIGAVVGAVLLIMGSFGTRNRR